MGKLWGKKQDNQDVDWESWLEDDATAPGPRPHEAPQPPVSMARPAARTAPITQDIMRRERIRNAGLARPVTPPPASVPSETASKKVSISLEFKKPKVPDVKRLAKRARPGWHNKRVRMATIGIIALVLLISIPQVIKRRQTPPKGNNDVQSLQPLVPQGSSKLLDNSDKSKVAYDPNQQVLSYSDTFLDKSVTVSQQPIPDPFKNEPDPAQAAAKKLGTAEPVTTAYGKAYIVTAAEGGGQTVILAYHGKLVFITSQSKKDADSWKYYIESLRPS